MKTTRKTITLSEQQDAWVKARIDSGDYTNDSEYFRDLIRRDQQASSELLALKKAIQEGLDSGISKRSVKEIWQEAERRHKA
ncbi:MAG TPA: type II toxin-antitoxin system ParD family antitoxin [Verrucomicrobiae bacterium]|nr:type II toxin-antitoxin system ParD family antitoxin [Verrucomicrobiae bacterium]